MSRSAPIAWALGHQDTLAHEFCAGFPAYKTGLHFFKTDEAGDVSKDAAGAAGRRSKASQKAASLPRLCGANSSYDVHQYIWRCYRRCVVV